MTLNFRLSRIKNYSEACSFCLLPISLHVNFLAKSNERICRTYPMSPLELRLNRFPVYADYELDFFGKLSVY